MPKAKPLFTIEIEDVGPPSWRCDPRLCRGLAFLAMHANDLAVRLSTASAHA